tara:strand:- start:4876 stop:5397 length:522 start_codon:yes stop_codon:yes gene_type:complete
MLNKSKQILMTLLLFLGMTASATMFSSLSFAIESDDKTITEPEVTPPKGLEGPMIPEQMISRLPIMVDCGPAELLMPDIVAKYAETPFASMDVMFRTPQGQVLSGKGTITVNVTTGTWSYIVSFGEAENICFFLSGSNFGPWVDPQEKQTKDKQIMPREGEMPGVTKRVLIDY